MRINRLLLLVGILCLLSCGKTEYSDIPYTRVSLTLYLGDKDRTLNDVYANKIITHKEINTSQNESAGFGGVMVYHHSSLLFLAYDIACPYEINANTTIAVDDGGLTATCPKCGSVYDLETYGNPVSGPSTESPGKKRLRQYSVIQSGDILRVTN